LRKFDALIHTLRVSVFLLITLVLTISCKKGVAPGGNNTNISFYGGPGDYNIVTMISTNDGGYLVCGNNNINLIPFLLKYDARGHLQWSNVYPNMHSCVSVLQTPDGGYAMYGLSDTSTTTVIVHKTNASGNVIWQAVYSDVYAFYPSTFCTDNNENYYASGQINVYNPSLGTTSWKMYVFKTNANQHVSWYKTYPNPQPNYTYTPVNMIIDNQGVLLINIIGNSGEQLLKIDSNGVFQRQRTINTFKNLSWIQNSSLKQNTDGSYLATFDQTSNTSNGGAITWQFYYHDLFSISISNDLKQKTVVHLDSIYNINLNTTTLTSGAKMNIPFIQQTNGNLFEAIPLISYNGYSQQQGQFSFILKNPQGMVILNKTLPGWPCNVILDKSGNYFICGLSLNPDSDTRCVFSVYIDANGNNIY